MQRASELNYRQKSSISFVNSGDPPFIRQIKEKLGYVVPATIDDKVGICFFAKSSCFIYPESKFSLKEKVLQEKRSSEILRNKTFWGQIIIFFGDQGRILLFDYGCTLFPGRCANLRTIFRLVEIIY
ncbi:unnamed protein product [Dracunculus medinensis]|uniref:CRAL-TRIO domain-containing protein n=1 Tax=Dracunculus medinensis TaxID=318479 RepID=A0A0N4UHH3_DRAME|nr:unnamed protein product [Dracunculus medinensis]